MRTLRDINLLPLCRAAAQVKKGFSQRRKVLRNALRPLHEPGQVSAALQAAGLSAEARAQDLTLAQFAALAWQLHAASGGSGGGVDEQQPEQVGEEQEAAAA